MVIKYLTLLLPLMAVAGCTNYENRARNAQILEEFCVLNVGGSVSKYASSTSLSVNDIEYAFCTVGDNTFKLNVEEAKRWKLGVKLIK